MEQPQPPSRIRAGLYRWLYVLALPTLLLNYILVTLAAIALGDPIRTSLLALSLNFIFAFPLAVVVFVLLVAVRTRQPISKLPNPILGGMAAVFVTLLLGAITYLPEGADANGDISASSSFASRVLNLDAQASSMLSDVMLWGFVAVLVYLIPICIIQLRQLRKG